MVSSSPSLDRGTQHGSTLLEVLITIVILAIGLLGLAGLQTKLQTSEVEAYQRSQALILLNDMAGRINVNRVSAADYVTSTYVGGTEACPTGTSRRAQDMAEWCEALKGAGETMDGNNVGAMVGGRGCIEALGDGEYRVTVAWQGLTPIPGPASGCGTGLYSGGSVCTGDLCRRTVTTVVRIGDLS